MSVVAWISGQIEGFRFLVRNLWASRGVGPIPTSSLDRFTIRGLRRDEMSAFREIHRALREGRELGFWRRVFYTLRGSTFVIVAEDEGTLVGFAMFYFREAEARRRIVHAAFWSVRPEYRKNGIAAAFVIRTNEHYEAENLSGISLQIRQPNAASVRTALRGGFTIVRETALPGGGLLTEMRLDFRGDVAP